MRKEKFVAVRKDAQGRLVEFKTSSGRVYDYEMAIEAVSNDEIENAELIKNRAGGNVIKGTNNHSLSDLPEF
jgi:hypothetical protein